MAGRKARRSGHANPHYVVVNSLIDPATTGGVQPSGLTGWTLKMSEEFGGTKTVTDTPNGLLKLRSDGPTWKAWYDDALTATPHINNTNEREWYDLPNITLSAGELVLTATLDHVHDATTQPYTSGMITSSPGYTYKYGFAEARLHYNAGADGWPAFWIIPASHTWPPEVDIWEITTGSAAAYTATNWGPGNTVHNNSINTNTTVYQTYGLKWTSTQLVWYLNGAVVATENVAGSVPQELMYIVVNLATTNNVTASYTVHCDYIRVWQ